MGIDVWEVIEAAIKKVLLGTRHAAPGWNGKGYRWIYDQMSSQRNWLSN